VLTRRQGFTAAEANQVARNLLDLCEVAPVDVAAVREASPISDRYRLSIWHSSIVAAALLSGCVTPYSEDMQDGQMFDERLKVVNPFK
jgi:predicted nucleic acid-binding protein